MADENKKNILIVDDEPDIRLFLQAALEDAGFNVVAAADGEEALREVKKLKPDLISLDLVMPKKSGIRFFYELRKNKEWSRIPVIIVTGHARDDLGKGDFDELFSGRVVSGPSVYLEKPVKAKDFVNMVKKELGLKPEERGSEAGADLQDEVQAMIKNADPKTLEKIKKLLS